MILRISHLALFATFTLAACAPSGPASSSSSQSTNPMLPVNSPPTANPSSLPPLMSAASGAVSFPIPGTSDTAQPCTDSCVGDCAAISGVVAQGLCASGLDCCTLAPTTRSDETSAVTTTVAEWESELESSDVTLPTVVSSEGEQPSAPPQAAGPEYNYAAAVENTSADCAVPTLPDPDTLTAFDKLPNPFERLDGTLVATKGEWRCRRQEIRKQAEKYVYGERPAPDLVSGVVTSTKIDVHVAAMGKSIDFSAEVVLPRTGTPPYPAIINLGAKSGFGGIALGESRILDQGVAVIYYNHYDLGKEGAAEQSRGKPNSGKFYDIYGGTHSAGLLQAWSWGASRMVDAIQQSDGSVIDVKHLGVTGCSRNGKGAFAVGLFDDRIALTIPHETSTAGVPVYRLVDILNTERTDHNYFGLNWFSDNFAPFVYQNGNSNVVKLPIDTHQLVALIAPRGLLVLDNPHQTQMSAPAGHLATAAGAEVFKALGVLDHVSYHSSVSDTAHCSYKNEYTNLLTRNISRFLKHEAVETGDFIVGPGGDGKLADWKAWATPTLSD